GQTDRYHHAEAGINSRLDEIQAAVLRVRLPRLRQMTERRRTLAAAYRHLLPPVVRVIREREPGHVYHLFAVRSDARDALQAHLRASGIETLIHYPVPLHEQAAFVETAASKAAFAAEAPGASAGAGTRTATRAACPIAARAARELLSLPLHPCLAEADVARVAAAVGQFGKG
ncbi:MAG: DegT/DnrJ/EryC1/StrS family aminotransferase, partial [Vicinamibacterales bacterium]